MTRSTPPAQGTIYAAAVGHSLVYRFWRFRCWGITPSAAEFFHLFGPFYWKRL